MKDGTVGELYSQGCVGAGAPDRRLRRIVAAVSTLRLPPLRAAQGRHHASLGRQRRRPDGDSERHRRRAESSLAGPLVDMRCRRMRACGPGAGAGGRLRCRFAPGLTPHLAAADADESPFSFFVTSLASMRAVGQPGRSSAATRGLAGADAICAGGGRRRLRHKTWRAFLSVADDGTGSQA
jgi:hypothetical protein